jgi:hypothetical protein
MEIALVVFFLGGVMALPHLLRRSPSWGRVKAVVVLFGVAFYGGMPLILGRGGILRTTTFSVIAAALYLVTFTIIGFFLLNRRIAQSDIRK